MTLQPGSADRPQVRTIGVVVDDFSVLAGATDFIVSVVDGLVRSAQGRRVIALLRRPPEKCRPAVRRLLAAGMPQVQMVAVPRSGPPLAAACRESGIDVVGPFTRDPPERGFPVPWFGYLYDFQHRHLPQYFEQAMIDARNAAFATMLETAPAIVVHSRSVERDARHFFPDSAAKIVPLPLSAAARPGWLAADPRAAQAKYGIGGAYFLVSNQFWVHKRHETAIEAFARIASRHPDLRLVMTGATEDSRAPTHMQDLAELIRRLGVAERVHILGFIPKLDQVALMRGARAVLQPTAFEGAAGGHSVYDAIALGVPAIVSDIPVNREIEAFVAAYFPLGDAAALAARMEEALAARPAAPSAETLRAQGDARRRRFGEEVWRVADYVAQLRRPQPPAGSI
jgi:glycosyltransferase involved in cell wall biosynthesis